MKKIALAWAAAAVAINATAQPYPNRPIRLVVPYSGGGPGDVVVRTVTTPVAAALGQQFVIEPKPGAGGNIAAETVAKAPADGYTLLFGTPLLAINASLYQRLSFDARKDLVPITLAADGPYVLYASGTLPVNNVADFITLAKAKPKQFNYASLGVGTGPHLGGVLFAAAAGVELTHVPYKGFAQSLPDLVSGQVHIAFNGIGAAQQFVQTGQVKMLGFSSARRLPAYPDVPSLAETVPGFELLGWYGFYAPAGIPTDILARLNTEFVKAVSTPEMADRMLKLGLFARPQTLAEARQYFEREIDRWGRAVKLSGARVED